MTKGVIFDVDGTLVTLVFDAKRTRLDMISELSRLGFDTKGLSELSTTRTIIEAAKMQSTSGSDPVGFVEAKKRLYAVLDRSELRTVAEARVFSGAAEALGKLKRMSLRLAAVTNSGRLAATEALRRSGLENYLEFVITRDDVGEMKPDPEGLKLAMQRLALPAGDVIFVGDSLMDVETAKRAGVRIVSVSTGNYSAERLGKEGPDHILGSVAELSSVVGA
ncbi:MAG: HAD family hydrolase [Thaumarchaeota archaeon]|nr:HAD family hydrolase [Nitrososphaerota archaeon]